MGLLQKSAPAYWPFLPSLLVTQPTRQRHRGRFGRDQNNWPAKSNVDPPRRKLENWLRGRQPPQLFGYHCRVSEGTCRGISTCRVVGSRLMNPALSAHHAIILSPYSLDLKPVERLFSKLKRLLRKAKEQTEEAAWKRVSSLVISSRNVSRACPNQGDLHAASTM
jgi:transposase